MKKLAMTLILAGCLTGLAEARQLRVLAIGNSFSQSLMEDLPKAAAAYPGCELNLVNLLIGGCTLERHWTNVEKAAKDQSFRPYAVTVSYAFDRELGAKMPQKANIQEMLVADRWDIVTIQQGSQKSWSYESYQPFADKLIAKIRELAPQAEIRVQQTWSYSPYSKRLDGWKMTPDSMFAAVKEAYGRLADERSLAVIPTGDAVRLYRERLPVRYGKLLSTNELAALDSAAGVDFHGDVVGAVSFRKGKVRIDAHHLNAEGRYLQACVWLASLFGVDVTKLTYEPKIEGFSERARLIRTCAAEAVRKNDVGQLKAESEFGAAQAVGGLWTPESQGLSSRAILRWVDHADRAGGFQSFVLMRHGKTLAEGWWSPCETNGTHLLYSLSKSFTSTAVGMLADERKLDLDEHLADIFPECLPPEPSANLLSMRVRDLLTMTTGHTNDSFKAFAAAADGDWRRAFMACPVPLRPGMRFLYDSGATYMLSSVVGRRSGQRMSDYLRSRLFDPLDIGPVVWNRSPQGDDVGGSELYLSTRDMAKFGQLWLQQGEWRGRRLLSPDYVRLASSKQTNNGLASFEGQDVREDWNAGYGFQFWMCRHNAFRGAGAYGQFVIVMRDQDAVMAINSNTSMQNTLESVWTHLLAEMKDRPLTEDPDGVAALRNRTASLARPTVEGGRVGATDGFGPHLDRASDLKVTFAAADGGWTLSMSNAEWQASVPVGYRRWNRGVAHFAAMTPCGGRLIGAQQVAASGAWQSPTEFRARLVFVQTPHDAEVAIHVGEHGDLTVSCTSANVSNARISKTTLKRFQ